MIKIFTTVTTILILSLSSKAQIGAISEDSVKNLLCHKWGFKAIIMGGQEMANFNETVTYEFFRNNTLQRITDKKTEKGTWTFDSDQKSIVLKIKKNTLFVRRLKTGDLTLSPDDGGDPSNNALRVGVALKLID